MSLQWSKSEIITSRGMVGISVKINYPPEYISIKLLPILDLSAKNFYKLDKVRLFYLQLT